MFDQQLPKPEEELEVEKEALEVARKYVYQFDIKDIVIMMCSKLENELYRLRSWRKEKTYNINWLVKKIIQ